jgi:hypothetical protein
MQHMDGVAGRTPCLNQAQLIADSRRPGEPSESVSAVPKPLDRLRDIFSRYNYGFL